MKNQTQALEQASVKQYCKAVRVPVIAANFVTLAEQAVKENQSHTRYLEALLAMESEERDRHAIENRIRDAQLPRLKTLPANHREGSFQFFPRAALNKLKLPETDRESIWPWFWQHRGRFFAAHCHCHPGGGNNWTLEESRTTNGE